VLMKPVMVMRNPLGELGGYSSGFTGALYLDLV